MEKAQAWKPLRSPLWALSQGLPLQGMQASTSSSTSLNRIAGTWTTREPGAQVGHPLATALEVWGGTASPMSSERSEERSRGTASLQQEGPSGSLWVNLTMEPLSRQPQLPEEPPAPQGPPPDPPTHSPRPPLQQGNGWVSRRSHERSTFITGVTRVLSQGGIHQLWGERVPQPDHRTMPPVSPLWTRGGALHGEDQLGSGGSAGGGCPQHLSPEPAVLCHHSGNSQPGGSPCSQGEVA